VSKNLVFFFVNSVANFGKGFDESNFCNMRNFYILVPIRNAVHHELS